MQQKFKDFGKLWAGKEDYSTQEKEEEKKADRFDYSNIDSVTRFEGTHPDVMQNLVSKEDWKPDIDVQKKNFKNMKHRVLYFLWRKFGWRPFEYSNYRRV
jgi:hypothetical protein